jgi:hypothetical protein
MPITLNCPSCGRKYQLRDDLAGRKVKCKACEQQFSVPVPRKIEDDDEPSGATAALYGLDDEDEDGPAGSVPLPSRRASATAVAPARSGPRRSSSTPKSKGGGGGVSLVKVILIIVMIPVGIIGFIVAMALVLPALQTARDKVAPLVSNETQADEADRPRSTRDLSAHTRVFEKSVEQLEEMNRVLASIHGPGDMIRAEMKLRMINMELQGIFAELQTLPPLTDEETRDMLLPLLPRLRATVDGLEAEGNRLGGVGLGGKNLAQTQVESSREFLAMIESGDVTGLAGGPKTPRPTDPNAPMDPKYDYVIVTISGMPDNGTLDAASKKLAALIEPSGNVLSRSFSGATGNGSARLYPVRDVEAFASSITFAEVRAVTPETRSIELASVRLTAEEREEARRQEERAAGIRDAIGGEASLDELLEILPEAPPGQEGALLRRLAEFPVEPGREEEVERAVAPMLKSDRVIAVKSALEVILTWRTPNAVELIIDALPGSKLGARSDLIEALGKSEDIRGAEALVALIGEVHDSQAVKRALALFGPEAEPLVIAKLQDRDPQVRRGACNVLADIGGQESLEAMNALPPDNDFLVRSAAQKAYRSISSRVGSARP